MSPKRSFTRGFYQAAGSTLKVDNLEWSVTPIGTTSTTAGQGKIAGGRARDMASADQHFIIRSLSTGRCLSNNGNDAPVLLPCDVTKPEQAWAFGKGLHSPSSLYSVQSKLALGVDSR